MTKEQMLELLHKDVVPALGCTEPVCVALCAAKAGTVLEGKLKSITVEVNPGLYKNAMSAGIPGCSMVGIPWAAAIGANLKNPDKGLQLLADITPETLTAAEMLIDAGQVLVTPKNDEKSIYVKCILHSSEEEVVCITRTAHTNIVFLSRNGDILLEKTATSAASTEDPLVDALKEMTIAGIRQLVCSATEEELAFMTDGIKMNEELAAYSETAPIGIGLAGVLRSTNAASLLGSNISSAGLHTPSHPPPRAVWMVVPCPPCPAPVPEPKDWSSFSPFPKQPRPLGLTIFGLYGPWHWATW